MKKKYMKTYQPTLEVNGTTQKSHHHHSLEERTCGKRKRRKNPCGIFTLDLPYWSTLLKTSDKNNLPNIINGRSIFKERTQIYTEVEASACNTHFPVTFFQRQ